MKTTQYYYFNLFKYDMQHYKTTYNIKQRQQNEAEVKKNIEAPMYVLLTF